MLTGLKKIIKFAIPRSLLKKYREWKFDESKIIYKGVSYREFLEPALAALRPDVIGSNRRILLGDIKRAYLADGTRPDEYLLHDFDHKSKSERAKYMPQKIKDSILSNYYGQDAKQLIGQLRNKYVFYTLAKPFFKRDVIKIAKGEDWKLFESFCSSHSCFICKIINGGCGEGIRIEEVKSCDQAKALFDELVVAGEWIVEELIKQDEVIASFNKSSVNTVRLPSFRHGNTVVQNYPFIRFGRNGSIVDNAGQGGIFASIDVKTGKIITNGFDELGHEYVSHPESNVVFKDFQIPRWSELLDMAKEAHMSLPLKHVYVGFDFALSDKGWLVVEGNWGDFICQQTSLKQGLKTEFMQMLTR